MNTKTPAGVKIQLDTERKIRTRNKTYYRYNHWPIWIFVFFLIPGPMTFDLFAHGFRSNMAWWLAAVMIGTGHRRLARQTARLRIGALYHPLHRR